MLSRSIKDLTPKMQVLYYKFAQAMAAKGHQFIVTSTARLVKEQVALYAQGRQPLAEVNTLRRVVGLPPITEEENKKCVTWTLKSEHLVDLDDTDPNNDKARAFDIVLIGPKGPRDVYWNPKADIDNDKIADYEEAGIIGESVGLVWGGRWNPPDPAHYQQPKGGTK